MRGHSLSRAKISERRYISQAIDPVRLCCLSWYQSSNSIDNQSTHRGRIKQGSKTFQLWILSFAAESHFSIESPVTFLSIESPPSHSPLRRIRAQQVPVSDSELHKNHNAIHHPQSQSERSGHHHSHRSIELSRRSATQLPLPISSGAPEDRRK